MSFKIFDHEQVSRGWVSFPDIDMALAEIQNRFDSYFYQDRDDSHIYKIELWKGQGDVISIHSMEAGSWTGCGSEEDPDRCEYVELKDDFIKIHPKNDLTKLNPEKDYIIVSSRIIV